MTLWYPSFPESSRRDSLRRGSPSLVLVLPYMTSDRSRESLPSGRVPCLISPRISRHCFTSRNLNIFNSPPCPSTATPPSFDEKILEMRSPAVLSSIHFLNTVLYAFPRILAISRRAFAATPPPLPEILLDRKRTFFSLPVSPLPLFYVLRSPPM